MALGVRSHHVVFALIMSVVLYFVYGLISWNVYISFTSWSGLVPSYQPAGPVQYQKMASDPVFLTALRNNLLLVALFIPASMALGLLMAVLLDLVGGRVESIFRQVFLLPFSLSFVVTAAMWAWMYNLSYGTINTLLDLLGLPLKANWLGDPSLVMFSIVLALTWQFSGYTSLVFLAGIKSIPESQIMAAKVDGASTLRIYTRVVLPQLKLWALSAFVVLMVFALKAFDFIFVLTNGGPGIASYVLGLLIYRRAFWETDFPYGAALATVLLLLSAAVVVPYLAYARRR